MGPSSSASPRTRRRLPPLVVLLFLRAAPVDGACNVNWSLGCSADRTATAVLTFDDDGRDGASEYDAAVAFRWGAEDASLGTNNYGSGVLIEETRFHRYEGGGQGFAGASITFGEGAACEDQTYERCWEVTLNDGRCDVLDLDDCADTLSVPAVDPPTISAGANQPVPSPPINLTPRPTTMDPSERPTARPDVAPLPPTTTASMGALREDVVSCAMALLPAKPMDNYAIGAWKNVTETTILDEALAATGGEGAGATNVAVEFREQGAFFEHSGGIGPLGARLGTDGVKITFTAVLWTYAGGEYDGPGVTGIVKRAFREPGDRAAYAAALVRADDRFDGTELASLEVNGVEEAYPSAEEVARSDGGEGNNGGGSNTVGIVAATLVAAAALLMCGIAARTFWKARKTDGEDRGRVSRGTAAGSFARVRRPEDELPQ